MRLQFPVCIMEEPICLKNVLQILFLSTMLEIIITIDTIILTTTHTISDGATTLIFLGVIIKINLSPNKLKHHKFLLVSPHPIIVANQGNNQLENILESFIQETKNQFLAQGVSIKNLENQVGEIYTSLSSRNMGALPSSTETPATTFVVNNVKTY